MYISGVTRKFAHFDSNGQLIKVCKFSRHKNKKEILWLQLFLHNAPPTMLRISAVLLHKEVEGKSVYLRYTTTKIYLSNEISEP